MARSSYVDSVFIISNTWSVVRTRAMRGKMVFMNAAMESSWELLHASRTTMTL